jgi:hypothetical protein
MMMAQKKQAAAVRTTATEAGRARLAAEKARLARILADATPPDSCGPEIPVAPARGAARVFQPVVMVPGGKQGWKAEPAGYRGRNAVAAMDIFDDMARKAAAKGLPAPFTSAQVTVARRYRLLVERHSAGGIRCSRLEQRTGSSGKGGEFMDAFVAEGDDIRRLRTRVGTGVAMQIRRIRPSARGTAPRGIISDLALVDAVCLEELTLSAVLTRFGWVSDGKNREALRAALGAALDRMAVAGRG